MIFEEKRAVAKNPLKKLVITLKKHEVYNIQRFAICSKEAWQVKGSSTVFDLIEKIQEVEL